MNSVEKSVPFLSLLSTVLTLISSLLLSPTAQAQTTYPMRVVKEARVMSGPAQASSGAHACTNERGMAVPEAQMLYYRAIPTRPVFVLQINKDTALYYTHNEDEEHMNSVSYWLAVKSGKKSLHYQLTVIPLAHRDDLPKAHYQSDVLTIEANSLSLDPNADNQFMPPDVPTHVYQTVRLGKLTSAGLELNILNCTKTQ